MINKDIINAFKILATEKGIDKTNLSSIIEDLFINIIRKKYGEEYENFNVIVNMEKGEIEIYQQKTVVKEVVDDVLEINLAEARKVEKGMNVGDMFIEVVNPQNFGRRLINNAKQFFNQSLRDIEKQSIYDEYSGKIGEIIIGSVQQIQKERIFVNCENKELILPKSEQIPSDRYRRGESIRAIIKKVDINNRGPEVTISRSDNQFLEKLFHLEVPEIGDDIIEIKGVARVPGDRSKIIVYSSDKRIDAVGACVGMKGMRIQSIVRELNGEKIDIINWSNEPEILITRALSPAQPVDLYIDVDKRYVIAVFQEEDLPIAIGRNGQNVKLVSSITGFSVDAMSVDEYNNRHNTETDSDNISSNSIAEIEGLSDKIKNILIENGMLSLDDFIQKETELSNIKGIGPKTLDKIRKIVQTIEHSEQ
ncbi:MAG: transcription termination/antitermination protein NusA [Candidatus Marinimicrobia bacterium]|nr:transcription termination/antitermination protein NusA [Candidatus Neomarinimicrobiota bacterium]